MIRIAPGRQLRWSPAWPGEDASVLFDAASGDFWVLSAATRSLLERVAAEPGLHAEALCAATGMPPLAGDETLASLRAAGLVAPVPPAEGGPA